jgi:FlaA1/EpsC-like NDP-sugar epimerase
MSIIQKLLNRYAGKYASRWLVLFIDLCIVYLAYVLAKLIRHNFIVSEVEIDHLVQRGPILLIFYLVSFLSFHSNVGIIRQTSLYDAIKLFQATSVAALAIFIVSITSEKYFGYIFASPIIIIIHFLISVYFLITARIFFKAIFITLVGYGEKSKKNVLIYGAGQSGIITLNTLSQDAKSDINIIGFIDDNSSKIGKTLAGIKIYSAEEALNGMLEKRNISEVILSIQNITSTRKSEIVNRCLEMNVQVKNVPPISRWINGELSSRQIKAVRIEDLLNREPIKLNQENIFNELTGKVIMITGAAGSIGSEIARQVVSYKPKMVIFVDQAETPMYELELNLRKRIERYHILTKFIIADVSNQCAMDRIFTEYLPSKVFHAAAYKHVPLMESNPFEAVRVNALGTKNMADLAMKYKVKKFVMVSTDKAVNPTNVMGATKRIAEMYIQSLSKDYTHSTAFITTRFGNVLGSNGSVIPLFKKQIEAGGPITVTHPEITRYFMTIPEACQLVLEAGSMGKGGEIFIFDMGESVKIIDVAKNMIKLSGLTLGKDIQIEITGLRPGEKLYEELLGDSENDVPTYHPKIKIANVQEYEATYVVDEFEKLSNTYKSEDHLQLVSQIKSMVKEYVSNNSIYETLD